MFLLSVEAVQVAVVWDSNRAQVLLEPRPSANLLRIGTLDHGVSCGLDCRSEVTQETMLLGSGRVSSSNGAWSGKEEASKVER